MLRPWLRLITAIFLPEEQDEDILLVLVTNRRVDIKHQPNLASSCFVMNLLIERAVLIDIHGSFQEGLSFDSKH